MVTTTGAGSDAFRWRYIFALEMPADRGHLHLPFLRAMLPEHFKIAWVISQDLWADSHLRLMRVQNIGSALRLPP